MHAIAPIDGDMGNQDTRMIANIEYSQRVYVPYPNHREHPAIP